MSPLTPSYVRPVVLGAAAWLVATALLHWLPFSLRLDSRPTPRMLALAAASGIFFGLLIYLLVRRRPPAQRFPAAAAIAMPVLLGDAIATAFFPAFFPKLNTDGSTMLAAILLLTNAALLAAGWFAGTRPE